MWHLWASKYGEYLIGTRHKNWLKQQLTFRFYPVDQLEWTEALLFHRLPFLPETREAVRLPVRVTWINPRITTYVDQLAERTVTGPAKTDRIGFLWGVEDLENDWRYNGFVPLGLVEAETPDEFSVRVPCQPDGRLISIEWGDVALKRAGARAAVARAQMNLVADICPGLDPVAVAERIERNPFAATRGLADGGRDYTANPFGKLRMTA